MSDRPEVDLEAALAGSYAVQPESARVVPPYSPPHRDPDGVAHIGGDVAGMCDRIGWARRRGAQFVQPEVETLLGWELGHVAEHVLLHRLAHGLSLLDDGWIMQRDVLVGARIGEDGEVAFLSPAVMGAHESGATDTIVGHIDALFLHRDRRERFVLDCKSTVWFADNRNGKRVWHPPAGGVKYHQQLQVATYALCAGADWACVYELDLGGKGRREQWIDVEALRDACVQRVREVLERTDPTKPEPDVGPNSWTMVGDGASWACGYVNAKGDIKRGYCPHTTCERHVDNVQVSV